MEKSLKKSLMIDFFVVKILQLWSVGDICLIFLQFLLNLKSNFNFYYTLSYVATKRLILTEIATSQ